MAVRRGDTEVVADMIDAGADVNARGECGYAPLHYAVEWSHPQIVRVVLSRGAEALAVNDNGDAAADIARRNGDVRLLKLLATWTSAESVVPAPMSSEGDQR